MSSCFRKWKWSANGSYCPVSLSNTVVNNLVVLMISSSNPIYLVLLWFIATTTMMFFPQELTHNLISCCWVPSAYLRDALFGGKQRTQQTGGRGHPPPATTESIRLLNLHYPLLPSVSTGISNGLIFLRGLFILFSPYFSATPPTKYVTSSYILSQSVMALRTSLLTLTYLFHGPFHSLQQWQNVKLMYEGRNALLLYWKIWEVS